MANKKEGEVSAVPATPTVDAELQARWDKFLASAEEQRKRDGTHQIFLAQKAAGEFDTIPASFLQNHNVRVAPR